MKAYCFLLPIFCLCNFQVAKGQWKILTGYYDDIDFISADSGIRVWGKFISVSGGNIYYANPTVDGGKTWDTIYSRGPDEGLSAEGAFACRKEHALYFDQNYQGLLTMFRTTDCKTYKVLPFKSQCDPAH